MQEAAGEVVIEVAKNAEPNLLLYTLISISVAVSIIGLLAIKYPDKFKNLFSSKDCDECGYKIANKTLVSTVNEATHTLGSQNGMIKALNVKTERLEDKIDLQTRAMEKMQSSIERVAQLQDKTADTMQELFITYKVQHKG